MSKMENSIKGTIKCTVSQDTIFKFLEWIFFIGLCIGSVWFASGVLKQFYSQKTSFAQYEVKITEYPVITIALYSQNRTEVNQTDVYIKYQTLGMSSSLKLQIGENHLYNEQHKKTEIVILDSIIRDNGSFRLGFRIIHATPILDKVRPWVTIHLYTNSDIKIFSKKTVMFLVTSREIFPGFLYWNWNDGTPMEISINKNIFTKCNIHPQITKYLKETGKCQEKSFYDCVLSHFDFKSCPNKCIPNVFSKMGKNYSTPFCLNDTDIRNCTIGKIMQQNFKHKCEKSCSKLEYFGQISRTESHLLQKENWNVYGFQYVLNNHNFAAKVYEEYFIYDAMEMIGSVGGTLGI